MRIKIYTRTGDSGKTSLYGGRRVSKNDTRVNAYGTVDELNSAIGVLISFINNHEKEIRDFLSQIQSDLFTIGGYLAGSKQNLRILEKRVSEMEKLIDKLDSKLPEIKNFILPSGIREASFAHLARSITRRAEREVVRLSKPNDVYRKRSRGIDKRVIVYLNRLSDLFFIIARYLNYKSGVNDIIWRSK